VTELDEYKLPKSPQRAAIEVGAVIMVVGLVIGVVVMSAMGLRSEPFQQGMTLGLAVAPFVLIGAAIARARQTRRNASWVETRGRGSTVPTISA
jgi:hypothetical protein